jgi:Flp pilus assembly pilin Flp
VEYMLAVAVLAVALAAAWTVFAEGVEGAFDNVRKTVQLPYP